MSVQPDVGRAVTRESSPAPVGRTRSLPPSIRADRPRWSMWLSRHSVLLALVATAGVHLLSLTRQLAPDEGGYSMVARFWNAGGGYLYGPQWVDRSPGLIGLFSLADRLGPDGARLTATIVAVALVGTLAWAAHAVGGRAAAKWTAWAAFAFASSTLLEAQRLNGELVAATFVALSVGALLRASRVWTSRAQTCLLAAVSGAAASAALLMKQNFVDAFAFAAVLLLVGVATRANRVTYRPARVLLIAVVFLAGASVPVAATLVWATTHGGVGALLYAMYGFRTDAAAVMASSSWAPPLHRLETMIVLGCFTGLIWLGAHLARTHGRRLRHLHPLPWAVATTVAVELLGVVASENFWPHYLIALIPMVALAAGLSATSRAPGALMTRRLVVLAVAVTVVVSPVSALSAARNSSSAYTTGRWVAASAKPTDTLAVPFTHSNVINASGLKPGYPYSWSLPARTLDPKLRLLTARLDASSAPTWVVRWDASHTWGFDPGNHVAAALRAHYQVVGEVCGHKVWLHDGANRHIAPAPPRSACGAANR